MLISRSTEARDSSIESGGSVLLVHVDGVSSGKIPEQNAVNPNGGGLALENLQS